MEITYFGHSCFLVNIGGYRLLFDPFIRPNEKASDIKVDAIEADYILLSHAHQDHSYDVEEIARKCDIPVIGIWEIHAHYEKKG
ncbi:MAG TPA: MBL fold metallo-hydrolase, partial [Catalimonadaceae bacterium]|nr:MBL fold metallo-hydrolase [Catalimonadaceae bacterium]